MPKRALITGITGQDGSYLAELLLQKGYEVHGIVRRVAIEDPQHRLQRLIPILDKITLHSASLESFPSLYQVIHSIKPDEVYHLAAQSFVSYSFEDEFSTLQTNINGTHYLLACCKDLIPNVKFYFAGSSEMFGNVDTVPQNETTAFKPRSTYGISKVAGFDLTRNYREAYGMFACGGILFNHESPRRGYEFVTRKITSTVAKIKLGMAESISLGNLDAQRDWGHAIEYVEAMWAMMQLAEADDFVIATGKTYSVRQFVEKAFSAVDIELEWKGSELAEVGIEPKSNRELVKIDRRFYRPAEVHILKGDSKKAEQKLNWKPKLSLDLIIDEMVKSDLKYQKNLTK